MTQTQEGALKQRATVIGVTLEQLKERIADGMKWCRICRIFQPCTEFNADASRADGLTSACGKSRREISRLRYIKRAREKGRTFVPPRDGDKRQARRRINYFVEAGLIDNPNALKCSDCDHIGSDKRHEYDHYKGYAAENHEHVQAVCSTCHHKRERARQ